MKLNSAYICVQNMDRAISLYEKILERTVGLKDPIFSIFNLDGFRLCLFNYHKVNEKVTYGDNCLLSFEVENMNETIEKLKRLKVPIVYPLTKIGRNWVLEFRDPEGNDVEIYSRISH